MRYFVDSIIGIDLFLHASIFTESKFHSSMSDDHLESVLVDSIQHCSTE